MTGTIMGCGGSTVIAPKASEINLETSDGIRLAAQSWMAHPPQTQHDDGTKEEEEELRVLCLHGWMDNCKSYYWLAPALIERLDSSMEVEEEEEGGEAAAKPKTTTSTTPKRYSRVHVVALDLPGHGLSTHRSTDAPPMVRSEYLFYIAEAIRLLKWYKPVRGPQKNGIKQKQQQQRIVLVGHSMSAGLCLMYAAAFPEQVQQLIMLDSLGQNLSRPTDTTSQNLRQYVQSRQLDGPIIRQPANRFYYPTLQAVIQARIRSPSMFPGKQYISQQAANELVQRGVVIDEVEEGGKKRYRFRHDPRLMWHSIQYFTEEQLEALYGDIQCPTCILLGEDGWPIQQHQKQNVQDKLKSLAVLQSLPGSHHLHMDPDTADRVVDEIVSFLSLSN